ncbi:MAG: UDP-N-acetylmuramoyl-L-alanyl-D-glutamate--2,6-diaminopimelate ligase [Deltaproteobacteria bacterium]|nr:UDP-N-acetylmuramoyl-L-alanyl-D-glutamate--2,6-diaminopimelate ligase [Candidatus Anaeroferrophillacea bacterium]
MLSMVDTSRHHPAATDDARPLAALLREVEVRAMVGAANVPVRGVTADSRTVVSGMVFVAVAGNRVDGHDFIADAWDRGAAAVFVQRPEVFATWRKRLPAGAILGLVDHSPQALAVLAAADAGWPAERLYLTGVTGTNGKTTVTFLVEQLLTAMGRTVGVIGTIGCRGPGFCRATAHTTPPPVELQSLMAGLAAAGVTDCVMEVSSHAIEQERVYGLRFAEVVFTNLSHEHLDYHGDLETYFTVKQRLFAGGRASACKVINADDQWGLRLLAETPPPKISFAIDDPEAEIRAHDVVCGIDGSRFTLEWGGRRLPLYLPLVGRHNIYNALAAAAVALHRGFPPADLPAALAVLQPVPGRLERVANRRNINVFIDYAHTPDALERVLTTLAACRPAGARLLTVFGCGGDRDRRKRPLMGALAARLSDMVVVTSDNPRTEEPGAIIGEILAGMSVGHDARVEPDRRRAIAAVLDTARSGDVVLVAGKGHETCQLVGDRRLPFDDRTVVRELLEDH